MNPNTPSITIRRSGTQAEISATLPVWLRKGDGNIIDIHLPLLGDLQTWADNEADIDVALKEAFETFVWASNQGHGIEDELLELGWRFQKKGQRKRVLSMKGQTTMEESLMRTGAYRELEAII